MIHIRINAVPIAQPRPKARAFNGHAQVYGAPKAHPVHAFKALLGYAAGDEMNGKEPLGDSPISVYIQFVLPRPKAKIRKRGNNPRYYHCSKPDVDNCTKAVLDALKGIVWRDDSCIAELHTIKLVAAGDEVPSVEILVNEIQYALDVG